LALKKNELIRIRGGLVENSQDPTHRPQPGSDSVHKSQPAFAPPDMYGVDASLLAIDEGTTWLIILSQKSRFLIEKRLKANVALGIE